MIRLNSAFRADLEWWHVFATSWNSVSMMREGTKECDGKVEIWSDASSSWGCGGLWGSLMVSSSVECIARLCRGLNSG